MNNPNPFVPQGSVLEHNKRRSRMKLAVFCVLVVSVCGLTAMLIQGCKREQENPPSSENPGGPMMETSAPPVEETSAPPAVVTSAPPVAPTPPVVTPVAPVVPEATGTEYVVVKGDTLGKIAKANHITLKALEDANPGVQPTKLKVGQKLTVPAGGTAAAAETPAMSTGATSAGGEEVYVVKSGDTLTKIAKAHGTTVKAIETENNLTTTKIKVGQKLKIPATAAAAAPAPVAPVAPAPMTPPSTAPAPAGAPTGN